MSQGVDALLNKGDIKQTLEKNQYSPNKRRFVEFWFICLFVFFFYRIRTSELFVPCELVSNGVVI